VTGPRINISDKEEQWPKVLLPILVTELGIVIDAKLEQKTKAPSPILVTEFGIVIDVKSAEL
jgi:hypothetical protein